MKVRFYPKTSTVLALLEQQLSDTELLIEQGKAEAENLDSKEKLIHTLNGQYQKDAILCRVKELKASASDLNNRISLLKTHAPPEVMCEIEV